MRCDIAEFSDTIVFALINNMVFAVEFETSLPAGRAGEGSRFCVARFLTSKLTLMSGEPTWGGMKAMGPSRACKAPCWLVQPEGKFRVTGVMINPGL
jgi:hypothetical protein